MTKKLWLNKNKISIVDVIIERGDQLYSYVRKPDKMVVQTSTEFLYDIPIEFIDSISKADMYRILKQIADELELPEGDYLSLIDIIQTIKNLKKSLTGPMLNYPEHKPVLNDDTVYIVEFKDFKSFFGNLSLAKYDEDSEKGWDLNVTRFAEIRG